MIWLVICAYCCGVAHTLSIDYANWLRSYDPVDYVRTRHWITMVQWAVTFLFCVLILVANRYK